MKPRSYWTYHQAPTPQSERLEPRRLLSGSPESALWQRLLTHTATPEDLASHQLAEIHFNSTPTYAKAGEWIVELNLDVAHPTPQTAVAQLGFGARFKKSLIDATGTGLVFWLMDQLELAFLGGPDACDGAVEHMMTNTPARREHDVAWEAITHLPTLRIEN